MKFCNPQLLTLGGPSVRGPSRHESTQHLPVPGLQWLELAERAHTTCLTHVTGKGPAPLPWVLGNYLWVACWKLPLGHTFMLSLIILVLSASPFLFRPLTRTYSQTGGIWDKRRRLLPWTRTRWLKIGQVGSGCSLFEIKGSPDQQMDQSDSR